MMKQSGYLSATEAAEALGISLSSLYSYVSRGLLRSEFADRSKRTRRYPAEDIQRLKERQEMRHDPQKVVDTALNWGAPVLASALTLIDGGRFYYRGRDVTELASVSSVEQVAELLWLGEMGNGSLLFPAEPPALPTPIEKLLPTLPESTPIERFQALLPVAAMSDLVAYDFRPEAVAKTGARLLRLMACLAISPARPATSMDLPTLLQVGWAADRPQAASLLRAALILCADHELNVSSFTARCVASAGSSPYAVVSAGLAALQGFKHGGASEQVEMLFGETKSPGQARAVLARRIRRGESVPGFGHRLYPEGDPRGKMLLEQITAVLPHSPAVTLANALTNAMEELRGERPNVDFGLATLCAALDLLPGTAMAIFALGRTIGWIGHAIEEYQMDQLIRPRAHYIGRMP
jgi:citrate synthase